MKIAITGGAGFIGSHLTKAYLNAGHDVLVIDNLAHGQKHSLDPRARFYQVDIRSEKLATILQMERPDIVSHHATQRQEHPGERTIVDADVHVRGLLNVLESCVSASVQRIIFASGGHNLYGYVTQEQLPLPETAPLCPHSAQEISKAAGEWYVRYYTQRYGLRHSILRYSEVYGDQHINNNSQPVSYFIAMHAEQRRPVIRGSGQEVRDYIFIDDVVQANLCALTRGENRTLHISTGRGHTLNHIHRMVAQMLASRIDPLYLTGSSLDAPAVVLDNMQARQVLGWRPMVDLEDGIRRLITRLPQRSLPRVYDDDAAPITDETVAITNEFLITHEATLSRI